MCLPKFLARGARVTSSEDSKPAANSVANELSNYQAYLESFLMLRALAPSCLAAMNASATASVWTNLSGGNPGVASKWSPNQVPGAADNVHSTDAISL